ncbi:MAG: DUF2336 domain-containing protein [Rhodospirillaceae bacterium]|nr:DUF2336 domain-containing protein [Rhodospirillaceae bacterium]
MSAIFNRIKNLFGQGSSALTYGQAKELASDQNPEVRKELAERIDVRPEILYFLAEDPDPIVRCEIAKNEAAPRQADAVLAKDDDIEVRSCLANKIARLAPNLNSMEREDIRHLTVGILEDLARDQVPKIRQILSDTLKDVADAPVSVIRQLAQDDELLVSVPVLENSPVLTDEDLLHIISNLLESKALSAISRRHAVSPGVADAIVDTDSKEAITVLLNNESAQIREETLDLLVDRSRNIEMWQGPLVRRPQLPASVALRLVENGGEGDGNPIQINSDNIDIALAAAKRLKREGKLEAKDIESALKTGDRQFVRSALAIRSELSLAVIEKIVKTRSAKGVMAMAWKAGLPMRLATDLQSKLAGISNGDLINPRNGFDYPMNDEELAAELSFFTD